MQSSSGQWAFADIAEVRMKGGDIPEPGDDDEELIFAAWKVYRYLLAKALREKPPRESVQSGRDGYIVTAELPEVYHTLWPAGGQILSQAGAPGDARGKITCWLSQSHNIAILNRGRQAGSWRTGLLPGAASQWWVAEEFRGVPEGMKLPGTEEDAPPPAYDASGTSKPESDRTWWCPFTHVCNQAEPFSRRGLSMHFSRSHKIANGSITWDLAWEEAEKLHGDVPEEEEELLTPPVAVREVPASKDVDLYSPPVPAPPPAPAPAPAPAPPPAPAVSTPPGSISAQARVFALQVAELEAENLRLKAQVAALEDDSARLRAALDSRNWNSRDEAAVLARKLQELLSSGGGQ